MEYVFNNEMSLKNALNEIKQKEGFAEIERILECKDFYIFYTTQ